MAYQINGNVVIDDSGQGFFENYPIVLAPTNVDPADGDTGVGIANVVLQASDFSGIYETFYGAQWQIANVSSFAEANIVYYSGNVAVASNTITTSTTLAYETEFYWRVRYLSNNNVISQFSEATSFTTAVGPPDTLGESYGGGFYTGAIDIGGGTCYYLILAPNATGCAGQCRWKIPANASPNTGSCTDGYANTYLGLNNASHPAGNWTATRTIGGFSDWYLPAKDELNLLFTNRASMPVGEGFAASPSNGPYWSSTQYVPDGSRACTVYFNTGSISDKNKYYCSFVRAIRRIPFSDF